MLFRYIRMEKSKNWIYDDVLFCKSSLSKMTSVKTNKIKNWVFPRSVTEDHSGMHVILMIVFWADSLLGQLHFGHGHLGRPLLAKITLWPKTLWPKTLWPVTLWPKTLWPVTLWPITLWPKTLWPVTLWPKTLWPVTLWPVTFWPKNTLQSALELILSNF